MVPPSGPLPATFSCPGFCVCVCAFVCVCVRGDTHKKNIYSVIFYICLITHWNRETENWKRNTGSGGGGRGGERKRGWLMLTESDRGERAAGFVFPADPNTESFLTRPTRHGVTE